MTNATHDCTGCPVSAGTHKPADAVHTEIAEPSTSVKAQTEAQRDAFELAYATEWAESRGGEETPAELAAKVKEWREGESYPEDMAYTRHTWDGYRWASAELSTLRARCAELTEEVEHESKWRDLALQFDGHRLQALWHLRAIVLAQNSLPERISAAEEFLKEPPISGEQVLAQRIAELEAKARWVACSHDFDVNTSAGGRGYVAWYFAEVMKRHDFTRYINDRLAADFACALAKHLAAAASPAVPAPQAALGTAPVTDEMARDLALKANGDDMTVNGALKYCFRLSELKKLIELAAAPAHPAEGVPADPMDWPLPCDVTVGGGTMRKGVTLRTLVLRMKGLYQMATGNDADEVAAHAPEERALLLADFQALAATPAAPAAPTKAVPYDPSSAMLTAAKTLDPAMPIEAIRAMWSVMWAAGVPAAAPDARDALDDTALLDFIQSESWDLRSIDVPTGAGDSDVHWQVIEHHMAAPHEREVGRSYSDDPREAIRDAVGRLTNIAAQAKGEQA